MPTAKLRSRGQVTIPKVVRDRLGLEAGDLLEFAFEPGGSGVVVHPVNRDARSLRGLLYEAGRPPRSIREMGNALHRAHGKR